MRKGWRKVKFSEIFKDPKKAIISGPFGSNLKSSEYQTEGVPLVRLQNVDRWKFINKNIIYITPKKADELSSHSYKAGDILITKLGAPLGKACIAPDYTGDGIILADIVRVRIDKNSEDKEFIVHQLNSEEVAQQLQELTTGATRPRVTLQNVINIELVIPPLPEQKQIVAILDQAFALIDQAKANIEKNIENAKELFQSKLNESYNKLFSVGGTIKINDVLEILTDYHANGSYKTLKANVELKDQEDYAWMVRSTDFENNFKNDFKYIDKHAYDHLRKSKIFGGELIISKIGNAGKVYLMPKVEKPCSLAMNLFLLRFNEDLISNEFAYYYFKTNAGERQIMSKLNGATTKTITKDSVRSLDIPLTSVVNQKQLLQELKKIEEMTNRLAESYILKLDQVEELKKSILQKAFTGELTKDFLNEMEDSLSMAAEPKAEYNS